MIWRFTPQKVRRFLFIRAKLLQKCLRRSICLVCSQELRAFFVEHIGKGFHFKAEFQDWLHNNAGKTYKEAVAAYHSIEPPKEIKPQFEYNQYIRDFFADNKGATLKDAIRCWYWKKLQPGSHRYEKSDIDAVED